MLTLKYTNPKLFKPVPLQLTQIMKAETHEETNRATRLVRKQPNAKETRATCERPFDNRWPRKANLRFPGLDNLGNTCYMNSMFQSILNFPQLLHAANLHSDPRQWEFESRFGKKGNQQLIAKGNEALTGSNPEKSEFSGPGSPSF